MAHRKLDIMSEKGFVILNQYDGEIDPAEWERLAYLDWKSGGDTNFAVLASANGLYLLLLLLGGMVVPLSKLPGVLRPVARALPAGADKLSPPLRIS